MVYTTHGLTFPKGSSLKTKSVYGSVEWFCSWMTDGIITINWEDYAQMKKMRCKNVYHINGVGVDTSRYHECIKFWCWSDSVVSEKKNSKFSETLGLH